MRSLVSRIEIGDFGRRLMKPVFGNIPSVKWFWLYI
jgi:hypothetical protein